MPARLPPPPSRPSTAGDGRSVAQALAVFAELLLAEAALADRLAGQSLAEAAPGEAADAGPHAVALRAWRALLERPGLRPALSPVLPAALLPLRRLMPGLRPLALLHLLTDFDALALAALLRARPAQVRAGLAQVAAGFGSEAALAEARAELARRMQAIPVARMVAIAGWRAEGPAAPQWPEASPSPGHARRLTWAAAFIALLVSVAWWLPAHWWPGGEPEIDTRPLADARPASRYAEAVALAGHPDRHLLQWPDADARIARETAFYAWYQAERLGVSSYEPPAPTDEAPESTAHGLPEPVDAP